MLATTTKVIEPLLDRRITNSLQMRELAQLRDTFLPRLISGKLRLPETTEAVEVALAWPVGLVSLTDRLRARADFWFTLTGPPKQFFHGSDRVRIRVGTPIFSGEAETQVQRD